jgi:uncharacterized protein YegL
MYLNQKGVAKMAKKKTKLSAYILLDRSGSMGGSRWENAIGSINTYVQSLRKGENVDAEITVAAFDSNGNNFRPATWNSGGIQMAPNGNLITSPPAIEYGDPNTFEIMRDKVSIENFKDLTTDELHPRGGTPLYDSTAKLINLADSNNNDKTVILIMTDGEENSSRTYNLNSIRDRISTCQKRGWEVVFLGAEFNAETVARNYGLDTSKVISTRSAQNLSATMDWYATSSMNYATTGAAINTTSVKAAFEQ